MTETDDPDLARFRAEAASWFADHGLPEGTAPHRSRESSAYIAAARDYQGKLFEAGLAGITWPREYSGLGLDTSYEQAFQQAAAGYETFGEVFTIGLGMCGPVLLALGTEEQKRRYLEPMLRGEQLWCQLFSEPGAGSDLASLATTATTARGDADGQRGGFVLNGQKVWNTFAQHSEFGLLLARTDPDASKHRGITMFVADMNADGVTCRPLKQATGDTEFNEVFLDNVAIPADRVVGTVNEGWHAATVMLGNERVALGREENPISSPVTVEAVVKLIHKYGLGDDPATRARLADVYALQRSVELFARRVAREATIGKDPGSLASIGKLATGRLAKAVAGFAMDVAGVEATAWEPEDPHGDQWAHGVLYAPSLSIAGGTDQIQRTILGERVLGLPREPQPDKHTPFRELRRSS